MLPLQPPISRTIAAALGVLTGGNPGRRGGGLKPGITLRAAAAGVFALVAPVRAQEPPSQIEPVARWFSPGLDRLKQEELRLRGELETLPPAPLAWSAARLGALSLPAATADESKWMQVDLETTGAIDAVVLIGACPGDAAAGDRAYGFPARFRVEISRTMEFSEPVTIADFTAADFPNPGLLPVWIPAPGVVARAVRVTATRLGQEGREHCLALGEMMVLRGERNLAAIGPRRRATASDARTIVPAWHTGGLIDGLSVLGAPVDRRTEGTMPFRSASPSAPGEPVWVQIDLGERLRLDEVLLFPAAPKEAPLGTSMGFPRAWTLSVSNEEDFAQERTLHSPAAANFADPGACPVAANRSKLAGRYLRLTAEELAPASSGPFLALAELQAWSGSRNVALGRPVTASSNASATPRDCAALVDGFADHGRIVARAAWLRALSDRRELGLRLAQTLAAQTQEWRALRRRALGWSLGAAALLAALLILRARRARTAELSELRLRLAQDLHDEIGSSLGGMSLLCQLAAGREDHSTPARAEFLRLHHVAHETATSARELVAVLREPENLARNLGPYFHNLAGSLLPGIRWELEVQRPAAELALPMRVLRQVRLVFKEALHNAARHAEATFVRIRLSLGDERLELEVTDDGCGFDAEAVTGGSGLRGLRERARALGGSLAIETAPGAGTTLRLEVPLPR